MSDKEEELLNKLACAINEFMPTCDCCWNCSSYVDGLCEISDQHDEENPITFKCDLHERDE